MIRQIKIILTGLFLSVFMAQAVLACVCDTDMDHAQMDHSSGHAEMPHDHHDMMDHGAENISDHSCEGDCHLSFDEQDGSDFVASLLQNQKHDEVAAVPHAYLALVDAKPVLQKQLALMESGKLPPPPTLHSEGILLLI